MKLVVGRLWFYQSSNEFSKASFKMVIQLTFCYIWPLTSNSLTINLTLCLYFVLLLLCTIYFLAFTFHVIFSFFSLEHLFFMSFFICTLELSLLLKDTSTLLHHMRLRNLGGSNQIVQVTSKLLIFKFHEVH